MATARGVAIGADLLATTGAATGADLLANTGAGLGEGGSGVHGGKPGDRGKAGAGVLGGVLTVPVTRAVLPAVTNAPLLALAPLLAPLATADLSLPVRAA